MPTKVKPILVTSGLIEIVYLSVSFVLAQHYGQWSYEGEMIRTILRIVSIACLAFFYRKYFYNGSYFAKPEKKFASQFVVAIVLLFLFALMYTNAENESMTWQLVFAFSGITAGFREELFYRGIVQNSLQKYYRSHPALLLTSSLFALVHIQYLYHGQILAVMLITLAGVIFGSIFIYTGSVVFTGLIHGLYDALLCLSILPVRFNSQAEFPLLLSITLLFLWISNKKLMDSKNIIKNN